MVETEAGIAITSGPAEDVSLYVSSAGNAIAAPRKAKGPVAAPLTLGANEDLVPPLATRSDEQVLAFTAAGACYRLNLAMLGVDAGKNKGRALVPVETDDWVVAVLPALGQNLLFVTDLGVVKRLEGAALAKAHAGGITVFKVPEDHSIIAVIPHDEGDEVLLSTAFGQALRIEISEAAKLRAMPTGNAGGVAGMSLKGDDVIVSAVKVTDEELLVVHETGAAKRVSLSEYPQKGRGTGGVQSAFPDKPAKGPAGDVVSAICIPAAAVAAYTSKGSLVNVDPKKIELAKRPTVSKPTFKLGTGEYLLTLAPGD
jgi:DNA gyrase subunit A